MSDLLLWLLSRSTGAGAAVALELSLLSGMALRTGALGWLTHNRGVRVLHNFATFLWVPLGVVHVVALLFDPTARIGIAEVIVPFGTPYGALAIGLGTISMQLFAVVIISSWLRSRLTTDVWIALHRLSYPAFVAMAAHTLLSGTDFAHPLIAGLAWVTFAALGALGIVRVLRPAATAKPIPVRAR